jgi:hypothetical protein
MLIFDKIKHLSDEQINEIFHQWYGGAKVNDLCVEFQIDKDRNQSFIKHFPPIPCPGHCPRCNGDLSALRSDQNNFKRTKLTYDLTTAFCKSCNHLINKSCDCSYCVYERQEQKNIYQQKIEKLNHEKSLRLESIYLNASEINILWLSMEELVYLASLIHQSTSEEVDIITPYNISISPLTPCQEWSIETIDCLLEYLSPFSNEKSLFEITENGLSWASSLVSYKIKIHEEDRIDFFQKIIDLIKDFISEPAFTFNLNFVNLCERLLVAECVNYLGCVRKEYSLSHQVADKTTALFKKLVSVWRVDQIYSFVWVACKEAVAYQKKERITNMHTSNMIVHIIDRYADKAKAQDWKINPYYREKIPQSCLSYIIFNKILALKGHGVEYSLQDIKEKLEIFE